jgi:hypothetical protein
MIEMDFRHERVETCCRLQNEIRELHIKNITEYKRIVEVLRPLDQQTKLNFNELYQNQYKLATV